MAHCVISNVVDTDDPGLPMWPACIIHTHWAPCPHNGKPANSVPLHTTKTDGNAERFWLQRTHGQRPLVMHNWPHGDNREHNTAVDSTGCWCVPEIRSARTCDCGGAA